jgi:hypothetical protein
MAEIEEEALGDEEYVLEDRMTTMTNLRVDEPKAVQRVPENVPGSRH